MIEKDQIEALIELYEDRLHDIRIFMKGVVEYIGDHPNLIDPKGPIVHSYKYRLKDKDHLREKIARKSTSENPIDSDNFFRRVTDLAGVRILHLFQGQFEHIDSVIRGKISQGDWILGEKAKAYTWDPESAIFFSKFELDVIQKPTSYTSVHYIIRPRTDSPICCEIQVRTLFEEIWGEVDHRINYPSPTKSVACSEQIAVLSKLVGAGSRLLDSLDRVATTDRSVNIKS